MARTAVAKHNQLVDRYDKLSNRAAGIAMVGEAGQRIELPRTGDLSLLPKDLAKQEAIPKITLDPVKDGEEVVTPEGQELVQSGGVQYISYDSLS